MPMRLNGRTGQQLAVEQAARHRPRMWAILLLLALPAVHAGAGAAEAPTGDLVLETTLPELVGKETAARFEPVIPADETIEWVTFVPEAYDSSRPPGLLVYISPTQSGRIPRGWRDALDAHNLIWLAAARSGNREPVGRRVLFANLAVVMARKHYEIDDERIYISGLSGGGKVASMVATDYPQLFRGAIYNCGVEIWDVEMPRYIEQMRQNRFVFVTGTHDQALESTERAHQAYVDAGIEHSKLMVIRNMTHRNPGRYDFEEALAFLDGALQAAEDSR
jgi:predicted esterase